MSLGQIAPYKTSIFTFPSRLEGRNSGDEQIKIQNLSQKI